MLMKKKNRYFFNNLEDFIISVLNGNIKFLNKEQLIELLGIDILDKDTILNFLYDNYSTVDEIIISKLLNKIQGKFDLLHSNGLIVITKFMED